MRYAETYGEQGGLSKTSTDLCFCPEAANLKTERKQKKEGEGERERESEEREREGIGGGKAQVFKDREKDKHHCFIVNVTEFF